MNIASNSVKGQSLAFFRRNKVNIFYILASAPIPFIVYLSPFNAVIPFYGLLLLFLKSQKLSEAKEASLAAKALSIAFLMCSFLVSFIVVHIFPKAEVYGSANYVLYILGLYLLFFGFSSLKEAFAPLFLIVAATSASFISVWLKPYLSAFANDFSHVIVAVLRFLGVNASIYYIGRTPVVTFQSVSGSSVAGAFVYECIGVYSALVFSIILVVILMEDPSSFKTRIAFSIIGLVGTFALNIVRVTIIFLSDYFYGAEVGGTVHYVIGYVFFSTWLVFFLYVYSKRQTLHANLATIWKKMAKRPAVAIE